ncbi:hypothetical protein QAD02_000824 [Eretmocerus hayati]|uniref:Uncharacterized protein n=1 Tax=Eretmocerus hayati TaxID=131215 RepID=A0ACC2NED1_9HYME|nr:hypothetical protein QAD02_000824 [Eretmocerus hayati]
MSLNEWYANREILLTGASSELGRNLLEKLLRSFNGVKVHVLMRARDGLTPSERLFRSIFGSPGYARLLQEQPDAASRVQVHDADLARNDLGLQKRSQEMLANVSIVFRAGGPSDSLFEFCRQLRKLQAVVVADDLLRFKGDTILENSMGERLPSGLPLTVVRLPALGPAHREPMPGYVELLKGSTMTMVGAGHILGRPDSTVEIVPRDIAANTLIVAAWDLGKSGGVNEPIVYNASGLNCTWDDFICKGKRANRNFRYPTFRMRGISSSMVLHYLMVLLFEWLPSYICDIALLALGQKTKMIAEYERIRQGLRDFEALTCRKLTVQRQKIDLLFDKLSTKDRDTFPIRTDFDIEAYILCAAASTKKYCSDESNLKIISFFMKTMLSFVLFGCGDLELMDTFLWFSKGVNYSSSGCNDIQV